MKIPPRSCRPELPICERPSASPWEQTAIRNDDDDQFEPLRACARCHSLTVVSSIIPKSHTDIFDDQIVPKFIHRLQNIFYLSRNIYSIDVHILSMLLRLIFLLQNLRKNVLKIEREIAFMRRSHVPSTLYNVGIILKYCLCLIIVRAESNVK